jgi:curved DNA-binding protein CbpA
MPRRDPHAVLGVPVDASAATIKAAWRRLAREHHPDLVGADAPAARAATRRMAEINAAYEELRTDVDRKHRAASAGATSRAAAGAAGGAAGPRPGRAPGDTGSAGSYTRSAPIGTAGRAPGGAPRPAPGRPVTARLDTTGTFQPRDTTTSRRPHRRTYPLGQQPPRASAVDREPPRASDPTGPLRRSRVRRFRPPQRPPLADALACRIEFGKFHGHTLGEIAAFEPSYIDWVAATITRDPDLTAAARVIRDDLDARGVARVRRAQRIVEAPAD